MNGSQERERERFSCTTELRTVRTDGKDSHAWISRAFIDGKTRFYRARARRNGSPPPRVCVALVLFKRFTFVLRGVDGGRGGERGGRGRWPVADDGTEWAEHARVCVKTSARDECARYLAESYCCPTFIGESMIKLVIFKRNLIRVIYLYCCRHVAIFKR